MKLSKRLTLVADSVPKQARLLDVGSDHAYLPTYLATHSHISFAIAGEIVQGPYESAIQTVQEHNVTDKIEVRLGDGIEVITKDDNIDTITICGMGGDLITRILERGYQAHLLQQVQTLVLQPNVDEQHVRYWLMTHHYRIDAEYIVADNGKIYEIIVAKPTNEPINYTREQLVFGVYLSVEKSPEFRKKWQSELKKYDKVLASLQKSQTQQIERVNQFLNLKAEIEEILQ